jgi:hypothetical protein
VRASINQTGRKTIPSDELSIQLIDELNLRFKWDFSNLRIELDSEVILELFSIGNTERISISSEQLATPGDLTISLNKYVVTKGIIGRLKVIKVGDDGIRYILNESKTLRLENDKLEGEHGKSLLDVYNDPQLRVPWQLIFDDGEPVLKVSDYHENAPKIYTHTVFQTSILPDVMKQIAFWLLIEDPSENQNSKVSLWWSLVEEFGLSAEERNHFTGIVSKDLEAINEIMMKCQEIADSFAVKHKILQKLSNYITEEEQ